jgi:hypothetical protein
VIEKSASGLPKDGPRRMGPGVRRDDIEVNVKLGHWPIWQIIPKEMRKFTKD